MNYNISPLSFAGILERAFQIFRDHFAVLVGISAVLWIPYGAVLEAGENSHVVFNVAEIALLLLFPVMSMALTTAVAHVYLDLPITVGDAYRLIRTILMPIGGTYLLLYVLATLGFIALVIPGIYLLNCWSLVAPVMVVEHRFGMAALRRSRQLVIGAWWRTFGVFLVAGLIVEIPAVVLQSFWSLFPTFSQILTAGTSAIASSYSLVVLVVYYFDRRCRTEDFNLRFLAQQVR